MLSPDAGMEPGCDGQVVPDRGFSSAGLDIVDIDDVAHEVKSGYVKYQSSMTRQIEKDAVLVRTGGTGIDGAVWHFVASDRSGTIGADPRVLDLLEENGIDYVIHLP